MRFSTWGILLGIWVSMFTPSTRSAAVDDVSSFIESAMACYKIPAMSIVVIKRDRVVLKRGFGLADVEHKIAATKDTKFFIGSLTKGFTSSLLAKLLQENRNVTWDTPLKDIMETHFSLSQPLLTEQTNLRDVLAHRLGIPSYFNMLLAGIPWRVNSDELIRRLRFLNSTSPFRSSFLYNNYLYALAGHVTELLSRSNKSWDTILDHHLLQPLGMSSSGTVKRGMGFDGFAKPYVVVNGSHTPVSNQLVHSVYPVAAAGAVYSTAEDMEKWLRFHLLRGFSTHAQKQLVSHDYLKATYEATSAGAFKAYDMAKPTYPVSEAQVGYGFGWMDSYYRGYRKIWHTGSISTFSSVAALLPQQHSGVAFVISGRKGASGSSPNRAVLYRILDYLLDEQPWLNDTTACTFPEPWSPRPKADPDPPSFPTRLPVRPLVDYTGVYGHLFFGNITITARDNYLQLNYGRFVVIKLNYTNRNHTFVGKYSGVLWFASHADGENLVVIVDFTENEKGDIDRLFYPLAMRYNTASLPFLKNLKLSDYDEDAMNRLSYCVMSSSASTCVNPVLLIFFVCMTHLKQF